MTSKCLENKEIYVVKLLQKSILVLVEEVEKYSKYCDWSLYHILRTQQVTAFLLSKGIKMDCNNIETCYTLPQRDNTKKWLSS